MKSVIVIIILSLLLVGCSETVPQRTPAEPVDEITVVAEPEPVTELGPVTEEEPVIEPETVIEEVEMPKDERKEGKRIVYEKPVVDTTGPIFVSGVLGLSESTPDEIVIKILYFDENGEQVHFPVTDGDGPVKVRAWKQMPPTQEEREALVGNAWWEWVKENKLMGTKEVPYAEFMVHSSDDTLVIPTSAIPSYDGNEVTVQVTIDVGRWEGGTRDSHFGDETLDKMGHFSSIYASLPKDW